MVAYRHKAPTDRGVHSCRLDSIGYLRVAVRGASLAVRHNNAVHSGTRAWDKGANGATMLILRCPAPTWGGPLR